MVDKTIDIQTQKKQRKYDLPDSPKSVGWTCPKRVCLIGEDDLFVLESGSTIRPIDVEYETYGELNSSRSNAILILHALSGDAHVAGWDETAEEEGRVWRLDRPGWWDNMVGPGKAFDTRKYFVICSNILGGCYGTTGPTSVNPKTGKAYGMDFPIVTVSDWVRLQERLISHLGIEKLLAVVGGSLGGQQALEWALAFPDKVNAAIIMASSARLSAQGLAFNAVARHAIITDPNFRGGDYYGLERPEKGLAVARMLGHITYLSEDSMHTKFGRRFKNSTGPSFNFNVDFEVESYLSHQGQSFVRRFDANSYLYITRAMDYYDASLWGDGDLDKACNRAQCDFLLVSFSSDWLFTPKQTKELAWALARNRKAVTYVEIPSEIGHDAFLLETEKFEPLVRNFLAGRCD